jgi:hypothetical protein
MTMSVDKDEVKAWATVVAAVVAALSGIVTLCDKTVLFVRRAKSPMQSSKKNGDTCSNISSMD